MYMFIYMRSVHKLSRQVIWKVDTLMEEDTRTIVHRTMMSQSPSKWVHWDLIQFSQSPSAVPFIFLNLINCLKSLPFQRWLKFVEKLEVTEDQILNIGGLSHLSDLMFCQKTPWDMMHEWVHCHDEAANHQLAIAAASWIIWIISAEKCSRLMQNLMLIHCSACSVILNATATQYTPHSMASTAPTD